MIISDIHGDALCLQKALGRFEEEKADVLILLGDLLYHGPRNPIPEGYAGASCAELLNGYADRIIAVTGNCDASVDQMLLHFPIEAPYMILPMEEGYRVVLNHGDIPRERLFLHPGELLLYGHTHVLKAEKVDGIYYANPGSISLPKEGNPKSYATLEGRNLIIKTMDGEPIRSMVIE
jgi:hypothetical protein